MIAELSMAEAVRDVGVAFFVTLGASAWCYFYYKLMDDK
jgi:hypothetical protein